MNDQNDSMTYWRRLLEPASAELLKEAESGDFRQASRLERLRERWGGGLTAAALELVAARRSGAAKFPSLPALVGDVAGVEQATGFLVAQHKAARFSRLSPPRIYDLCCGIGGDALALAAVARTRACDIDPLRAWMCGRNLEEAGLVGESACEDVESLGLEGEVVHIDPSRREEDRAGGGRGRRAWSYHDYRPGPEFIESLLARNPDSAVKLGPGVRIEELPLSENSELEFIEDSGRLVQAVLWSGRLALNPGQHTASLLPLGEHLSGRPAPLPCSPAAGPEQWIAVAAPSLERAGLLAGACDDHGLAEMAAGLGILTGASPVPEPWFKSYEVLESMPWRPRKVAAWLAGHDAGIVDVKTRGGAVNPEEARKKLRGGGDSRFIVFILRLGKKVVAIICAPPGGRGGGR